MINGSFQLEPKIVVEIKDRYDLAAESWEADLSVEARKLVAAQRISVDQLGTLLEAAFWASLMKEEGRYHSFSVAFGPPDPDLRSSKDFVFGIPRPLTAATLAKLAPSVSLPWVDIGVWPDGEGVVSVWGFTQLNMCVSLNVRAHDPGRLLVSFPFGEKPFAAFISGSRAAFVGPGLLLSRVLPLDSTREFVSRNEKLEASIRRTIRLETELAPTVRAMRSYGQGGTLLIVPGGEDWKASIHEPIIFSGEPYRAVRADLEGYHRQIEKESRNKRKGRSISKPLGEHARAIADRSLSLLARLTAMDGAVVVTYELIVLAFGAKIKPVDAGKTPDTVLLFEPFEDSEKREVELAEVGGTRHQSAAQFIYDRRNAIAIVVSQDGGVSVIEWDFENQRVSVKQHSEFTLWV